MLTKQALIKFIFVCNDRIHSSNDQFEADARSCGFTVEELGPCTSIDPDPRDPACSWTTPYGKLVEKAGRFTLHLPS